LNLHLKSTLFAAGLAALLPALAGCSSSPPPPPQVFAPLTYNYLPPIVLTVSNIEFQNNYVPDPSAETLIGQDPAVPADTVMAMAQHRLVASGTPGTATFTLQTASIEPVGDNYVGTISVQLNVVSADGLKTGFTEASVSATQTAPGSDATANQVQAVLYSMTKQMMDQLNVQLQYHIQHDMGSWVSYSNNTAAPGLNSGSASNGGIVAAPLPAPGATAPLTGPGATAPLTQSGATAPVTGSSAPATPPAALAPVPLAPGSGILGQMPVSPQ
jgi:hypothetical protein